MAANITSLSLEVAIFCFLFSNTAIAVSSALCIRCLFRAETNKIGKSVNVGAGTITCNYDGIKKSKTKIADNVFIGSNSSLVAPISIGKNSVVGAGSVITKNVKKKSLALTQGHHKSQLQIIRERKNNVWNYWNC